MDEFENKTNTPPTEGCLSQIVIGSAQENQEEENISLTKEESAFIEKIKNEDYNGIKKKLSNDQELKIWEYRTSNNNDNSTILHLSTYINNTDITKELINYCKEKLPKEKFINFINQKNKKGIIALHYASFRGNIELIKYYLENDSEINSETERKLNVIHFACQGNKPNSLTYFYLYHKNNIDFEKADAGGSTPLHWACYSCAYESAVYLIHFGVDLNKGDNSNYTPLYLAVLSKSLRIVRYLLQKGAKINIKDKDDLTPIDIARKKKLNDIYELLLTNKKCSVTNFKAPAKKISKNYCYCFVLVFFQLLALFILVSVIFPCMIIYKNNITSPNFLQKYFYDVLFISYVVLSIIFTVIYLILLIMDPGYINENEKLNIEELLLKKREYLRNFCFKCRVYFSEDIRHCIICEKCCKGFDHHCYWINNDVGENNYCLFLIFLIICLIDLILKLIISITNLIINFNFNLEDYTNKEFCLNSSDIYNKIINIPFCVFFIKNDLYIKIANIILIAIALLFILPSLLLVKIHFKVYFYRIKQKMAKNRESTFNLDRVDTDKLVQSEENSMSMAE